MSCKNVELWQKIHIDLAVPRETQRRENKSSKTIDFKLQILTIIGHATCYPELPATIHKQSEHAENKTGSIWFLRCPRPQEYAHGNGAEFTGRPIQ